MDERSGPHRFGLVLTILGVVVVLTYLLSATGVIHDLGKLVLILIFAIGPVAIVGVLSIRRRLARTHDGLMLQVGTTFLVIGFAFFNLFVVVQQYVQNQMLDKIAAAPDEAIREALKAQWRVVDLVQQGMDVSFDIFYCVGLVLVAAVMYRHPDFGRFLGGFGVLAGAALLVLNLIAFPYVPADSGLVDLGPVSGLWWLLVIGQMVRLDRRDRSPA
jgi:hypothetical protein